MGFLFAPIVGSATRTSPFVVGDDFPSVPGVYFVKAMGFVKIGFTADFAARYIVLDRMMPETPEVLAFIEASRALETTIHRTLKDICLKNEWYPDCDEVRAIMADALAGKLGPTHRSDAGTARPLSVDIKWASDSLRLLAEPIGRDEPFRQIVERAAARVGLSYWRTFDLWYAKARRLESSERSSITAALESSDA